MEKSLIQQELEGKEFYLTPSFKFYKRKPMYRKNDIIVALQKARERLRKKRFCLCRDNPESDCPNKIVRWSDIEKEI